jgi:hypothetical protein
VSLGCPELAQREPVDHILEPGAIILGVGRVDDIKRLGKLHSVIYCSFGNSFFIYDLIGYLSTVGIELVVILISPGDKGMELGYLFDQEPVCVGFDQFLVGVFIRVKLESFAGFFDVFTVSVN